MFKSCINAFRSLVLSGAVTLTASPAFAAMDTAPIEAAKADLLAVAAALLAMGVAVWGAMKVVRFFGGK